jgi:peptide deformylase
MGKGRILHFGFAGAAELFEAEAVPYKGKHLGIDNHLRNIAIREGVAALSSPMVGDFWKALIMLKRQNLRPNQWNGYTNMRHSSFDTYLNPQVVDQSAEEISEWEECCGYPGLRLMIPRARKVMVSFKEESKFEDRSSELLDFSARLFLHEMNHIECIDPLKVATKI